MAKFTRAEIDTAIKVMAESSMVKRWVEGQARAFHVRLDTIPGKLYYKRECVAAARRLIK